MITYENFVKKFKDTETFEKQFPAGTKFRWYDRNLWHIVGYCTDDLFKNKDDFNHLVIMKSWSKYKQRWTYNVCSCFEFYSIYELMIREEKQSKKKKSIS